MTEATSCGGVVIFRGKILLLYKNYKNRYEGWVLPKGTVEKGEEYNETALREVHEETGVKATIVKYVGKSSYTFTTYNDVINKDTVSLRERNIFVIRVITNIMRLIICLSSRMRSRYWNRLMKSTLLSRRLICGGMESTFKVEEGYEGS